MQRQLHMHACMHARNIKAKRKQNTKTTQHATIETTNIQDTHLVHPLIHSTTLTVRVEKKKESAHDDSHRQIAAQQRTEPSSPLAPRPAPRMATRACVRKYRTHRPTIFFPCHGWSHHDTPIKFVTTRKVCRARAVPCLS